MVILRAIRATTRALRKVQFVRTDDRTKVQKIQPSGCDPPDYIFARQRLRVIAMAPDTYDVEDDDTASNARIPQRKTMRAWGRAIATESTDDL